MCIRGWLMCADHAWARLKILRATVSIIFIMLPIFLGWGNLSKLYLTSTQDSREWINKRQNREWNPPAGEECGYTGPNPTALRPASRHHTPVTCATESLLPVRGRQPSQHYRDSEGLVQGVEGPHPEYSRRSPFEKNIILEWRKYDC